MTLSQAATAEDTARISPALADYVELAKPRITVMVMFTVAASMFVATWGQVDPILLFHALVGTGLVTSSANTWNQWWERDTDRHMRRTALRPLPAGRLDPGDALVFGSVTLVAGIVELLVATTGLAAAMALATWVLYVGAYTPLKRSTSWNTLVGAVPGALPVLIGWTAVGAPLDLRAVALFLVVFFWQFPHFMAIAWRCRDEYAAAGIRMLTVVEPTGHRAALQAVLGALALLPTSLIPVWLGPRQPLIAVIVTTLSLWYFVLSIRFLASRNEQSALQLMRASLAYLPLVLLCYALIPWTS